MGREKTKQDAKKEKDQEQGKGEPQDLSGIPVGEKIPDREALASPSVAGRDLNPQDQNDAETSGDTNAASTSQETLQRQRAASSGAGSDPRVNRGIVTAVGQQPQFIEARRAPTQDQSSDQTNEDGINPELLRREREEALRQDAARLAAQPNTEVFETEVDQRKAALQKASNLQ